MALICMHPYCFLWPGLHKIWGIRKSTCSVTHGAHCNHWPIEALIDTWTLVQRDPALWLLRWGSLQYSQPHTWFWKCRIGGLKADNQHTLKFNCKVFYLGFSKQNITSIQPCIRPQKKGSSSRQVRWSWTPAKLGNSSELYELAGKANGRAIRLSFLCGGGGRTVLHSYTMYIRGPIAPFTHTNPGYFNPD